MDTRRKLERNDGGWLNLVSVADYADASVPTVRRWLRRGLLPASKLASGTWRIRRDDLEAFLQGKAVAPSASQDELS
ncbi:helix-turn-helix domain-containing protein [Aureliella helgolandensis]|uniref:Helix-turn-helix domain protein n=1 Tax=Aureliella helgolandensis TaxID=2527968 RepID=A0A518GBG3_9BACT|nr:helix-turn-helix domain-containing protein [Aureliella helgolandensis]QDV25952.1 Helix-turn-helix domain protein [Aureliella helgolandensis]